MRKQQILPIQLLFSLVYFSSDYSLTKCIQTTSFFDNDQGTMAVKYIYGKVCKNMCCLIIHQCKMKCLVGQQEQHTDILSGEMKEENSQESLHTVQSLQASELSTPGISTWKWIKWPSANKKQNGKDFIKIQLKLWPVFKGDVDRWLQIFNSHNRQLCIWRVQVC